MGDSNVKQVNGMFNEVRPVRGFEDIVQQIQEAVVQGRLQVGDRLPSERELCAIFGVSRPTLREAIRSLEAAGVVEVLRGTYGGTFISEPKAEQVGQSLAALIRFRGATAVELAEFRTSFESETALWAAKRATEENKQTLFTIVERIRDSLENTSVPWSVFVDLDLSFHEEVARASQNQIRVAVMMAIYEVIRKNALVIGEIEDTNWRKQQYEELTAIATAIGDNNIRQAKRLMRDHVSRNSDAITGLAH
ncbi:FadR family transcriptional regulator [Alicyclobacillus fastidiosus]|uniref:FadR family transcriptional regulator n=1 Tax=Alicyclobacillus fastidiosus TaxID=392011 RepID=A0ABY6ZE23_9BACL|nr:FadR/GntR family transcriptional regulator [Alicyclobacillus fastidiosus]WAH40491.1 FadR family transcriptional regulator [Alicyclobacillus fastidiosus]GMA61907.1 GntR family transcriptional regulator [Alicyclobacillus fastidiosus]